jgi:hypothetical protein
MCDLIDSDGMVYLDYLKSDLSFLIWLNFICKVNAQIAKLSVNLYKVSI